MRLELTRVGLLVELANNYTTRGASISTIYVYNLPRLCTLNVNRTESLLHSLEQTARGIGLYVNANKIESMSFKQEGTIFILRSEPLKLVDQFTYLGRNISSTENEVTICLAMMWTAIEKYI